MGDWPVGGGLPYCYNPCAAITGNTNNQEYIVQVASPSANTKGDYQQIVASLPFNTGLIIVVVNGYQWVGNYMIDVAIGAEGAEIIIANNIFIRGSSSYFSSSGSFCLPFNLPAGTRLSVRAQGTYASTNYVNVSMMVFPSNAIYNSSLSICQTYGATVATTVGVDVDAGGTADTKGAWAEISAAVGYTIRALIICAAQATDGSANFALDIGIGAVDAEVPVIQDYSLSKWTTTDAIQPAISALLPITIVKGSRLSARCKCSVNTASLRILSIVLYGIC